MAFSDKQARRQADGCHLSLSGSHATSLQDLIDTLGFDKTLGVKVWSRLQAAGSRPIAADVIAAAVAAAAAAATQPLPSPPAKEADSDDAMEEDGNESSEYHPEDDDDDVDDEVQDDQDGV